MSSSLKSEESSGQLQHVAIEELISQGIDDGDVKKLTDAGIVTCNGLMMHTKEKLTEILGLFVVKVDQMYEAAQKLVIMEETEVAVKYKNYKKIIFRAVKKARKEKKKKSIVFKLAHGEILILGPMKNILLEIKLSNKVYGWNDKFNLEDMVPFAEKDVEGRIHHDPIVI